MQIYIFYYNALQHTVKWLTEIKEIKSFKETTNILLIPDQV